MTTWRVPEEAAGTRLDRYLAAHYDVTRSRAQRWIRDGLVTVGQTTPKPSLALRPGDPISCDPPDERYDDRIDPEEGPLVVLHEDDELIVLDKPPGLTVHPGAGRREGTLAHRLLHHYPELAGVGGPGRPGIVHRLDKDTSGVMAIARTDASYRSLQQAFESRNTEKHYLAIVHGRVPEGSGTIDRPIGRHPRKRKEMTLREDGRPAVTDYEALAEAGGVTLLRIRLHTGRTHQIRVHLKAIRHPLVGDPVYGEARWREAAPTYRKALREFPRPALHAWRLAVPEVGDPGRLRAFTAEPPDDLELLWSALGGEALRELALRSDPARTR